MATQVGILVQPSKFDATVLWDYTGTYVWEYSIWRVYDDGTQTKVPFASSILSTRITKNTTDSRKTYTGTEQIKQDGYTQTISWNVTQLPQKEGQYRIRETSQIGIVVPADSTSYTFKWTIDKWNDSTQKYEQYETKTDTVTFSPNTGMYRISRDGFFHYLGLSAYWQLYVDAAKLGVAFNTNISGIGRVDAYVEPNTRPIAPRIEGYLLKSVTPPLEPVSAFTTYECEYIPVRNHQQAIGYVEPIPLSFDNFNDSTHYTVNIGQKEIFKGRLYWVEGNDINITVNDIARQYLKFNPNIIDNNNTDLVHQDYQMPQFVTHVKSATSDIIVDVTNFYYDFTYKNNITSERTEFITDEVEYWQIVPYSYLNYNGYDTSIKYRISSAEYTMTIPKFSQNTWVIYPNETWDEFTVNGNKLKVNKCSKAKYVLYWVNRKGGWNWCSVNGKATEKETFTKSNYTNSKPQTTDNSNWENINYNTDIKKQWQFNIGNLTDEQSKILMDIYSSPYVYVHSKDDNQIYAANVTDKSAEYKTFKNQGRKSWFYTINLEQSMNKQRTI